MPKVKPGMKKSEYVKYCISFVMKNEGLEQKAAVGKCYGLWKAHLKDKKSKGEVLTEEEINELKEIDNQEKTVASAIGKL